MKSPSALWHAGFPQNTASGGLLPPQAGQLIGPCPFATGLPSCISVRESRGPCARFWGAPAAVAVIVHLHLAEGTTVRRSGMMLLQFPQFHRWYRGDLIWSSGYVPRPVYKAHPDAGPSSSNCSIRSHASAIRPVARSASASRRCPCGVVCSRQAARARARASAARSPAHSVVRAASRNSQALTATRMSAARSVPQRAQVVTPRHGARQVGQRSSIADCGLRTAEFSILLAGCLLALSPPEADECVILSRSTAEAKNLSATQPVRDSSSRSLS